MHIYLTMLDKFEIKFQSKSSFNNQNKIINVVKIKLKCSPEKNETALLTG